MRLNFVRAAALLPCTLLSALPHVAMAQQYPSKPIRMIVPFPPGGSVDTVARLIAPKMSESLGQGVVLDNRAGASSNIGMEAVARAAPDGYTLLINTVPIVANPSLFPQITFKPERDFAPISMVVSGASILFVHPSVPVRTVKELIALAKSKPGELKYTSSGAGTLPHLATELFRYMTKTDLVQVAYKGGGPALIALISGECDLSMQTLVATGGQISAGRLRALAVTSKSRLAALPAVPTLAESGVPGYEFNTWVGVLAPAATPPALIKLLNEHAVRAARTPEVNDRVTREGAEVVASTPEAFRATIAADTALWGRVIREMNIKAD
jgi:tripartite-type tricarboxylate transporter receptor subunit TctC